MAFILKADPRTTQPAFSELEPNKPFLAKSAEGERVLVRLDKEFAIITPEGWVHWWDAAHWPEGVYQFVRYLEPDESVTIVGVNRA